MIDAGKVGVGKIVMRSKENPVEKNGMTWVDPSLLVEVSYFEKAEGGHFRFPVLKWIAAQKNTA